MLNYYYPNRPILVPPDPKNPLRPENSYINSLERSGKYLAEQKWNGDNCQIFTGPTPSFWNRYYQRLKYIPSPDVLKELKKWPADCILNAELVHNKTKAIKDLFIVHCVMAWEGKILLGKTWGDSRKILEENQARFGDHLQLSSVWKSGFWDLFQEADASTIEGIILKNPLGKLVFSAVPIQDVPWMLKIRKPCKKYSF